MVDNVNFLFLRHQHTHAQTFSPPFGITICDGLGTRRGLSSYALTRVPHLVASGAGGGPLGDLSSRARAGAHAACRSRIKTKQPAIHLPAYVANGMRCDVCCVLWAMSSS